MHIPLVTLQYPGLSTFDKFQVYFIISSNGSPGAELKSHCTILKKKTNKQTKNKNKNKNLHQNMFTHSKILIILKYLKTLILHY